MSTPQARLAGLGLVLPPVAAPVAAYVPAVRTGSYVYTAGQLPLAEGKLLATGKVGAADQRRGSGPARPHLRAERTGRRGFGGGRAVGHPPHRQGDRLRGQLPGFTGQPQVLNGASELLLEVLGEAGRHARSAVGVAELPLDAPVEVELIAEVGDG